MDGISYEGGQHGFARDAEHDLLEQTDKKLVLQLRANQETRAKFPFDFLLTSSFTLTGNTVHHTLTVDNPGEGPLHLVSAIIRLSSAPLTENTIQRTMNSVLIRWKAPWCWMQGQTVCSAESATILAPISRSIPLTDRLFDNDSYCMTNLKSSTLGIYEKDSDRSVVCRIEGFPYTLIWSQKTEKIRFVCIEPWHSLPGVEGGSSKWEDQAAAAVLQPGEQFSTTTVHDVSQIGKSRRVPE